MRQARVGTVLIVGAFVTAGLAACTGHVSRPRDVSSTTEAAPTGPDWQRLDSTCQGGITSDPERCSLVADVKEITVTGTHHRLLLTQFANAQGVQDLGAFASRADQPCTEGYQRACTAARLARCWGKLSEARLVQGRNPAVQTEYGLAVQALAKQVIKVSPTTGEAVAGPNFDEAEPHADAALAAAKAAIQGAVDAKASADAEKTRQNATLAGEKECEADASSCEASCTADAASDKCWLLALLHCTAGPDGACMPHWSKVVPTDLSKARELAARSCKAGNAQGCTVSTGLESMVTARTEVTV
jgi:hypothetical protein